jgi:hypothetical protein
MTINLSPAAIAERKTWKYKVIQYLTDHVGTGDNYILILILKAVFGMQDYNRIPRMGDNCVISKEGILIAKFKNKDGRIEILNWPINNWRDMWNRVADRTKLSDDERKELFAALRGWIHADYRAKSNTR